jgi:hypothetical protein
MFFDNLNKARKWCFNAGNASALIFWAGLLQRFAAQNDRPEFRRGWPYDDFSGNVLARNDDQNAE